MFIVVSYDVVDDKRRLKMAQALLDIQRNYGLDYVKQRIENLKQADPAGYAARKQLFDKIIEDAKNHPGNRMAEDTQAQVTALLWRGASLSTGAGSETEDVQQAVQAKKAEIASGAYKVFTGPIKDQAGTEKVAAGAVMSDEELLGFNWFVQGVVGTLE